jgi:hypothetical protein
LSGISMVSCIATSLTAMGTSVKPRGRSYSNCHSGFLNQRGLFGFKSSTETMCSASSVSASSPRSTLPTLHASCSRAS